MRRRPSWLPLTALMNLSFAVPAAAQYKMTTPIAPSVAVPDRIESSTGELKLFAG